MIKLVDVEKEFEICKRKKDFMFLIIQDGKNPEKIKIDIIDYEDNPEVHYNIEKEVGNKIIAYGIFPPFANDFLRKMYRRGKEDKQEIFDLELTFYYLLDRLRHGKILITNPEIL